MGLNLAKGNMYGFVSHTWNTIKGQCPHDCSYCYMKKWGHLKKPRLDERELSADLGIDNFIFVGSSCDMFADRWPLYWISETIAHCRKFKNKYLFQSKNPDRMKTIPSDMDAIICTTIESNRWYSDTMRNSPHPMERAKSMSMLPLERHVTIEPILDFDLYPLLNMVKSCAPSQVNIGCDSGNNGLPEPSLVNILKLIEELAKFSKVHIKDNMRRLLNPKKGESVMKAVIEHVESGFRKEVPVESVSGFNPGDIVSDEGNPSDAGGGQWALICKGSNDCSCDSCKDSR